VISSCRSLYLTVASCFGSERKGRTQSKWNRELTLQRMNDSQKNFLLYIIKCVTAAGLIFLLSPVIPGLNVSSCLISVVLVLSPDAEQTLTFVLSRIAANLVGGVSSLLCSLLGTPDVVTVSLAYSLTITMCSLCRLMGSSRSALAAVTIILLHPSETRLWNSLLERALSVGVGCLIALLITLVFHRRLSQPAGCHSGDHPE
jgi:uncharacterized membrane protein YgaE (UPF0421/DUF939 family)